MQNNFAKLLSVIACHSCTVSCTGNIYCKSHISLCLFMLISLVCGFYEVNLVERLLLAVTAEKGI
jgi:hypothetical protein